MMALWKMRESCGEMGHPCLMLDCAVAGGLVWLMVLTWKSGLAYILATLVSSCGKPNLWKAVVRTWLGVDLYRKRLPPVEEECVEWRWTDLLSLKPNCVCLSLWSTAASILLCKNLAKSLYVVESREMSLYVSGSTWLS